MGRSWKNARGKVMCAMTWMNGNGVPSLEAQALFRQAREMAGNGRYEAAAGVLKQVVMLAPRFTRAYEELGNCLERIGRYPEALAAFARVLELEPFHDKARCNRDAIANKVGSSSPGDRAPSKIVKPQPEKGISSSFPAVFSPGFCHWMVACGDPYS